ncbi:MAG: hypothetical protein ACPGJV_07355 [Bacteriovoracaceae bacterium]
MKKVLLHPRNLRSDLIDCLYLVHHFNLEHEDCQAHILLSEKCDDFEILHLSPFECEIHHYQEQDLKTLPLAHKYAYNLHDVFNIDYYFDFHDSVVSAFLGTCFRAKEKIGYRTTLRKVFLTRPMVKNDSQNILSDFFNALDVDFRLEKKDVTNPFLKPHSLLLWLKNKESLSFVLKYEEELFHHFEEIHVFFDEGNSFEGDFSNFRIKLIEDADVLRSKIDSFGGLAFDDLRDFKLFDYLGKELFHFDLSGEKTVIGRVGSLKEYIGVGDE